MKSTTLIVGTIAVLLCASCASGPDYRKPSATTPTTWKEGANWREATPNDHRDHGAWWMPFADSDLDALVRQVEVSNQNLLAAEAAWRQATAVLGGAKASYAPTIGANAGAQRTGQGAMPVNEAVSHDGNNQTQDRFTAQGTISWSPDLWGRLRRTAEGAEAGAQASAADLANARLSAQAALITAYMHLRITDQQRQLLGDIANDQQRSLDIARHQHAAGLVSRADVLQAEAQLASDQSQAVGLGVQRAQYEHAIAMLIGRAPSEVTIAPRAALPTLPEVPLQVPSALLESRPDIAAAERRMAAANAQIGIAQSAYYPDLTLSGALGFGSSGAGSLVQSSNLLWSIGGQLAGTLFDGGARDAKVAQAKAAWDQVVANYRQTVLTAFQQTEDQLAAIRILAEQSQVQSRAVDASVEAERVIMNQYRSGTVGMANVLVASNAVRSNRLTALQIQSDRLVATTSLMAAMGGGWQVHDLAVTPSGPPASR